MVFESGRRIFLKKIMGEAPSILAASHNSSGMVRKNCRNKNVQVADATSGRISPW